MCRKTVMLVVLLAAVTMIMGLILFGCGKKPEPKITSITPTSGEVGTQVKIMGNNFKDSQGTVYFAGESASIVSWSATSVVVKVPTDLKAGKYDVSVKTEDGQSNQVQFEVTEKEEEKQTKNQSEVLTEYAEEKGYSMTGVGGEALKFEMNNTSKTDPSWELWDQAQGQGEDYRLFLLHQVNDQWTVVADGWNDFDPQANGAPEDLTPINIPS